MLTFYWDSLYMVFANAQLILVNVPMQVVCSAIDPTGNESWYVDWRCPTGTAFDFAQKNGQSVNTIPSTRVQTPLAF